MKQWDVGVIGFHWLLVLSLLACYISASVFPVYLDWHIWCGLCVFTLLTFRVLWGWMGTTTARFRQFFPTWLRLKASFKTDTEWNGHTPIGAISVLVMLVILGMQAITGLFSFNDELDVSGPLYVLVDTQTSDILRKAHTLLFDIVLFLIALHLCAIIFYDIALRKMLIKSMLVPSLKVGKGRLWVSLLLALLLVYVVKQAFFINTLS